MVIVVTAPDRVAEVADIGIGARPLSIKYGRGAEGQQGRATSDIDSDPTPEPDRGPTVQHRQQRDQPEQPQRPEQRQGKHEDVKPVPDQIAHPLVGQG